MEPPIYAYLLAGIFKLAGTYSYPSLWIGVGLNAVLSAFTAVLILRIGKRDFSAATGILAAWIWSAWLYEAVVAVRLWESSISALFLMIAWLWLPPITLVAVWRAGGPGCAHQYNSSVRVSVFLVVALDQPPSAGAFMWEGLAGFRWSLRSDLSPLDDSQLRYIPPADAHSRQFRTGVVDRQPRRGH